MHTRGRTEVRYRVPPHQQKQRKKWETHHCYRGNENPGHAFPFADAPESSKNTRLPVLTPLPRPSNLLHRSVRPFVVEIRSFRVWEAQALLHLLQQDRATASTPVSFIISGRRGHGTKMYGLRQPAASQSRSRPRNCPRPSRRPLTETASGSTPAVSVDDVRLECSEGEGACAIDLSVHQRHARFDAQTVSPEQAADRTDQRQRPEMAEGSVLYSHESAAGSTASPAWVSVHRHRTAGPGISQEVHTR